MADLKLKAKAPNFSLNDKDGIVHELRKVKASYLVVFFYPKDDTPGCTLEAKGFSRDLLKFKRKKVVVIGISGGDEISKANFCKKHKLKIDLLSDPDFKVCKKYGSFGLKKFMGKSYLGIHRRTFILDQNYRIIKIFNSVTPLTHSKDVLEFISSI